MGWVISHTNEWKDYFNSLGKGVEISRNWATVHFSVFVVLVGTVVSHVMTWCHFITYHGDVLQ